MKCALRAISFEEESNWRVHPHRFPFYTIYEKKKGSSEIIVVRGDKAGGVHDEAKSEFVVDGRDDGLFHPQQIPIQVSVYRLRMMEELVNHSSVDDLIL